MEFSADTLARVQKAKQQGLDGRLAIWNLRLEALVAAGATRDALALLTAGVDDAINNCGCNVQCGARGAVETVTRSAPG